MTMRLSRLLWLVLIGFSFAAFADTSFDKTNAVFNTIKQDPSELIMLGSHPSSGSADGNPVPKDRRRATKGAHVLMW